MLGLEEKAKILFSRLFQQLLQTQDFIAVLSGLNEVEVLGGLLHQLGGIVNTLAQLLL